jgi:hypothetical protein
MSIGSDLLLCADVETAPVEKPAERFVDELCEYGRIQNGLPEDGRGKDRFTTE